MRQDQGKGGPGHQRDAGASGGQPSVLDAEKVLESEKLPRRGDAQLLLSILQAGREGLVCCGKQAAGNRRSVEAGACCACQQGLQKHTAIKLAHFAARRDGLCPERQGAEAQP